MTKKAQKQHILKDSPFYKLSSKKKLAELLFTNPASIKAVLATDRLYVRGWKHKTEDNKWLNVEPLLEQQGNYRPIDKPDSRLKIWQSRIAKLLGRIIPPDYLFSPVKSRSYVDNAVKHKSSQAFWMLDIANYFPSCTANNVAWFFSKVMHCSPNVVAVLVRITTYNQSLPQGSPCSPILAYFSNMNMWEDIRKIAEKHDCVFSVYADDITLSSKRHVPKHIVWKIKQRIKLQGLAVKEEKEASVYKKPASITGVVINNNQSLLPNKQHQRLSDLRHDYAISKNPVLRKKLKNQLAGRVAQKGQIEGTNKY